MQPEAVKALIEAGLPGCEVTASGDGSHFDVIVIGEVFAGKTPVNRQRLVYATVNEQITSGALHAINIKAYTKEEWEKARKLQIS
jgi:acid stress-induced BolA-like protein IbaG/YrbA